MLPLTPRTSSFRPILQFHHHCHPNLHLFNPVIDAVSSLPSDANTRSNRIQLVTCTKLPKKKAKSRLVTISTSDGKWHGNWNCDYTFSLQQLVHHHDYALEDDVDRNAEVSISLCIQKHSGLGMSVEGRIKTCFTRKCFNCCLPYLRQIDTPFKVWILPSRSSSRKSEDEDDLSLSDIGSHDPSLSLQNSSIFSFSPHFAFNELIVMPSWPLQVIYVNPGCEADLDSLIQDTIQLVTSVRETCSEDCANSQPQTHYLGSERGTASLDRRWNKLLELKKDIP